jgi:hypothetical protein
MNTYTPRRQSKRWLDGDCPRGVLAIYDNGGSERRNGSFDRYTIFYVPFRPLDGRGDWISYLAASANPFAPQGFGQHGELEAYKVAEYRYRRAHDAAKWSSLPEDVKRCVRKDLSIMSEEGETA